MVDNGGGVAYVYIYIHMYMYISHSYMGLLGFTTWVLGSLLIKQKYIYICIYIYINKK